MENLFKDVRYGVRMLTKNPGVTLVALITLALGIGANTAISSAVNAFLMRPLSATNPDELVRPLEIPEDRGPTDEFSYPDFLDYRNQITTATLAAEDMIRAAINAENQNEIGIRLALGAQLSDVLRLVLRQGLRLTLIGAAIGLLGAYLTTRDHERALWS